jgi:protocatechuate 3,4-dioxygenase beta subunit
MSTKRDDTTDTTLAKPLSRRQLLEGLSALAATSACGSNDDTSHGAVAETGTGGAGTGGVSVSGGAPASGGTGSSGAPVSASGSAPSVNASGGTPSGGATASGGTTATSVTANGGTPAGGASASGGTASGGAGGSAGNAGAAGAGGSTGDMLVAPPFDDVPMCTASRTDGAGQGPFFIHDTEKSDDISLYRQDIRGRYNDSAEPGVEMHLHLRVLASTSTSCNMAPVSGIDVYIWHTDAQGYYSGFGTRGGSDEQKPDNPYAGVPSTQQLDNTDRFLRGVQTTDANGIVSFRSIFPGWYNGRCLHIHFVAFKQGSMSAGRVSYNATNSMGKWLFTTQFYFDPSFSHSIHEKNQPYLRRTTLSAYQGALAANEPGNSMLHAKASLGGDNAGVGGIVTAQMQILLDPKT